MKADSFQTALKEAHNKYNNERYKVYYIMLHNKIVIPIQI